MRRRQRIACASLQAQYIASKKTTSQTPRIEVIERTPPRPLPSMAPLPLLLAHSGLIVFTPRSLAAQERSFRSGVRLTRSAHARPAARWQCLARPSRVAAESESGAS